MIPPTYVHDRASGGLGVDGVGRGRAGVVLIWVYEKSTVNRLINTIILRVVSAPCLQNDVYITV